jgi:hypothetical protein
MKSNLYILFILFVFGICPNADAYKHLSLDEHPEISSSYTNSAEYILLENGRTSQRSELELFFPNINVIPNSFRAFGFDHCYVVQFSDLFFVKDYNFSSISCFNTRLNTSELPLFKQFSNYRL